MDFGSQLKEWRSHRRLSQLELAMQAGISSRHVSFLETGRARPSEGMILRLASVLDIPARGQGLLFSAAGYRPRLSSNAAVTMERLPPAVAQAIRLIIERHAPYPAMVFDHEYNLILTNEAFLQMVEVTGIALAPGDNFLEAYLLMPQLRDIVVNWDETAADLVHRIRGEAWLQGPGSSLGKRLDRIMLDDDVRRAVEASPNTDRLPVLPVSMNIGGTLLNWITTLTSFGSAQDALTQGILIESFFPADDATRRQFGDA